MSGKINFIQIQVPKVIRQQTEMMGGNSHSIKMYITLDGLKVLRSVDPTPHGNLLHCSISCEDESKYPTWEEIKAMKEEFFGDRTAIMVFPRKELYVNHRANCFHLWELPRIPGPSGDWEVG